MVHGELHDLLASQGGTRVSTPATWARRRSTWLAQVVDLVYGGMPPRPDRVELRLQSHNRVQRLPAEPTITVYRVRAFVGSGSIDIGLQVLAPQVVGSGRGAPVVIDPDECWWNLDDASVAHLLSAGVALARFDRTDAAPDPGVYGLASPGRSGGLYDLLPDHEFGALAAWAWGIHVVVDALVGLNDAGAPDVADGNLIDAERVAVTGFSRGGKAALLAGATDERIGLVHAHASGAGGAAPFLLEGEGAEGMRIVQRFPGWFGRSLAEYQGRVAELPVDQHALLAAVAPRPLLITCGSDDAWANPTGTNRGVEAARAVYELLDAPGAVEFHSRPGGHHHGPEDWATLLSFMQRHW